MVWEGHGVVFARTGNHPTHGGKKKLSLFKLGRVLHRTCFWHFAGDEFRVVVRLNCVVDGGAKGMAQRQPAFAIFPFSRYEYVYISRSSGVRNDVKRSDR